METGSPYATALLKFRRIVEANGLADEILARVNAVLEAKGIMMHRRLPIQVIDSSPASKQDFFLGHNWNKFTCSFA